MQGTRLADCVRYSRLGLMFTPRERGAPEQTPRLLGRASLVRGDWEDIAAEIREHPQARVEIADAKSRLSRKLQDWKPTDLIQEAGQSALDTAQWLASLDHNKDTSERLSRVEFVVIRSEDPILETVPQADGGYLIRMSETFLSNQGFLLQLLAATRNSRTIEDRHIAIAAARFHLLWQCMSEQSMMVGYSKVAGRQVARSIHAALVFALTHELGHVALGHLDGPVLSASREKEREADKYAATALSRTPWRVLPRTRSATSDGIKTALLTVEFRRIGQFIRAPITHDGYKERMHLLSGILPWVDAPRDLTDSLHGVLQAAADFTCQLPPDWWQALYASPDWQTSMREDHHNSLIMNVDKILGRPPQVNLDLLRRFEPENSNTVVLGVTQVLAGNLDLSSFLSTLGVRHPDEIADASKTLSRQHLLSALTAAPGWQTTPDEPFYKRLASFVLMELIEPSLIGEADDYQRRQ